jgi:hypothetical protein
MGWDELVTLNPITIGLFQGLSQKMLNQVQQDENNKNSAP